MSTPEIPAHLLTTPGKTQEQVLNDACALHAASTAFVRSVDRAKARRLHVGVRALREPISCERRVGTSVSPVFKGAGMPNLAVHVGGNLCGALAHHEVAIDFTTPWLRSLWAPQCKVHMDELRALHGRLYIGTMAPAGYFGVDPARILPDSSGEESDPGT